MGLVQGYTAIQEIQEQAWRMGNHPAPGRSGSEGPDAGKERDCLQHSQTREPEGSDKAVAVVLSQAGGNGEELESSFNFRPFAFFYPSTFSKYFMLGIVFFWIKFL